MLTIEIYIKVNVKEKQIKNNNKQNNMELSNSFIAKINQICRNNGHLGKQNLNQRTQFQWHLKFTLKR